MVLVCDRRTFEVWYRLPQFPGFRTLGNMVVPTSQYAKQSRVAPLSPMGQTIFCVSTTSRDIEGPPQDIRIRLTGQNLPFLKTPVSDLGPSLQNAAFSSDGLFGRHTGRPMKSPFSLKNPPVSNGRPALHKAINVSDGKYGRLARIIRRGFQSKTLLGGQSPYPIFLL